MHPTIIEEQLNNELDLIYKDLSGFTKTEYGVKKVTDYEDRFYYFLAPAILLLLLEYFLTERKSPLFSKLNKKLGLEWKYVKENNSKYCFDTDHLIHNGIFAKLQEVS